MKTGRTNRLPARRTRTGTTSVRRGWGDRRKREPVPVKRVDQPVEGDVKPQTTFVSLSGNGCFAATALQMAPPSTVRNRVLGAWEAPGKPVARIHPSRRSTNCISRKAIPYPSALVTPLEAQVAPASALRRRPMQPLAESQNASKMLDPKVTLTGSAAEAPDGLGLGRQPAIKCVAADGDVAPVKRFAGGAPGAMPRVYRNLLQRSGRGRSRWRGYPPHGLPMAGLSPREHGPMAVLAQSVISSPRIASGTRLRCKDPLSGASSCQTGLGPRWRSCISGITSL